MNRAEINRKLFEIYLRFMHSFYQREEIASVQCSFLTNDSETHVQCNNLFRSVRYTTLHRVRLNGWYLHVVRVPRIGIAIRYSDLVHHISRKYVAQHIYMKLIYNGTK